MANVAPGPAAAGGSQKSQMSLPMGELKALFITFLKQQGYEVPVEFNNFINAAVSKISSRDSSPCMSVCSGGKRSSSAISSDEEPISEKSDNTLKGSDEEAANSFKIVKRKSRKVARRQLKNSTKNNSSDESDPTMEVELNHVKKLVHRDSPASPDKSVTKTTIVAPKQSIVGVKTPPATGSKPSPPPKVKLPPPICLRDKTKWNFVSAECTRMHINYTRAQNTKQARVCGLSGVTRRNHTKEVCPVNAIGVNFTDTQLQIVSLNRDALSVWSHTGPKTANATRNQEETSCCNCDLIVKINFPPLSQTNRPTVRAEISHTRESAGGRISRPAPPSDINKWKNPLPWVKPKATPEPNVRESPTHPPRRTGAAASALGEDINTIMSILQVVRSAPSNGRKMETLAADLHFDIITPLTPTHYPNDVNRRPDILDIALLKGVALKLSCIETLQCLNSDHRPVLMRLGSLTGDCPPTVKTITNWQKVSTALEEIDTPMLNNIPNDIVSTDDIDNAIGALTNHIRTVVDDSSRTVPANSDRKELPRDVKELIRAKNAALRRASKYPTCENRSEARILQRKSQSFWGLAKALKTEKAVPTPALRKLDNSIAFDDREKAECLADSIEQQCSENPAVDIEHVRRVEEEVRRRVSLPPKDDLDPITHDEAPRSPPLLYSAYVNDIPRPKTGVQLALFADDTALFLRSNCLRNILPRLQRAIDELTQWLRLWRIEVNPEKSASIYFDYSPRKSTITVPLNTPYLRIQNQPIPWQKHYKYLEEQLTHHGTSKNSTLHRDFELPTISKFMKDASERFFDIASNHPNPLLVEAVTYEPPPPNHFCRRPRNILTDPPDDLTVEVEKLIELNKMVTD
ncbi:RNA-directed DNA polymerase from mobile element jockey [Eumeta japonica]|uniref:RNA-directed DNA polymerase from mobile element jockey n=1 Tax=Eumeta variegata TaxID=151549 RepID=A0A4C1Z1J6_EUMVA|nr:RNA-directed DNA polymerase from mobile element jockey [Eumeta japonica]